MTEKNKPRHIGKCSFCKFIKRLYSSGMCRYCYYQKKKRAKNDPEDLLRKELVKEGIIDNNWNIITKNGEPPFKFNPYYKDTILDFMLGRVRSQDIKRAESI